MKAITLILSVLIITANAFDQVEADMIRADYLRVKEQPSMLEFYKRSLFTFLDLMQGKAYTSPSRPESRYKAEHDQGHPEVGSVLTWFKNNWVLFVSIGVSFSCYYTAWIPLFVENDAGAFFTDCMTMWTMYVYFFQDPEAINYSY
jgi:hypothetical protein